MYFQTSHYAYTLRPDQLLAWSEEKAKMLVHEMETRNRVPILCFTGMSGTGHATALSLELVRRGFCSFGMAYVRKRNEISHGSPDLETSLNRIEPAVRAGRKAVLVLVDEQVSSGATRDRVFRKVLESLDRYWDDVMRAMDLGRFVQVLNHEVSWDSWDQTYRDNVGGDACDRVREKWRRIQQDSPEKAMGEMPVDLTPSGLTDGTHVDEDVAQMLADMGELKRPEGAFSISGTITITGRAVSPVINQLKPETVDGMLRQMWEKQAIVACEEIAKATYLSLVGPTLLPPGLEELEKEPGL